MTAELGDWLTDLGGSQPAAAAEVGAALMAVMQSAEPAALAAVGEPTLRSPDPRESADRAYQRQLEDLQRIRRQVAEVATERKRTELLLAAQPDAGGDVAALAQRLAVVQQREARLTQRSMRLEWQVDAFRSAKESAKALYTAAEAQLRIAEDLDAVDGQPDADLAQLRANRRAAGEKLRALEGQASRWGAVIREEADQADGDRLATSAGDQQPKPPPPPPPASEPAPGLLELRADPLGSDIRMLFAVEPSDCVTLLAVLEGPEAISEHGARAIKLAGNLLTEIRADGWPTDLDELVLADAGEFLARFFPADDGSIARRATALADSVQLSRLREDLHLSIDEVAARSGLQADRIVAIEAEGLRTAHVHEAVALARALGARLELPAGPGIGALSY